MFSIINKINIRAAYILLFVFYIASVVVHFLVISRVITYTLINGGRSASYEAQVFQSTISLGILVILLLSAWLIARPKSQKRVWKARILYGLAVFWLIGLVQQLIGTPFERYVMTVLVIIGVIIHVRLAQQQDPRALQP